MNKTKHTPTPWKIGLDETFSPAKWDIGFNSIENGEQAGVGYAKVAARCYTKEDAAFIVRAVNSHEALLDAAKRAEKFISEEFPHLKGAAYNMLGELRDAIAEAEGK